MSCLLCSVLHLGSTTNRRLVMLYVIRALISLQKAGDTELSGFHKKQLRITGWWRTVRLTSSAKLDSTSWTPTEGTLVPGRRLVSFLLDIFASSLHEPGCKDNDLCIRYWTSWKHTSAADLSLAWSNESQAETSFLLREYRYRRLWRQCDTLFDSDSLSRAVNKRFWIHELQKKVDWELLALEGVPCWLSRAEKSIPWTNSPNTCHNSTGNGRFCNNGAMPSEDVRSENQV